MGAVGAPTPQGEKKFRRNLQGKIGKCTPSQIKSQFKDIFGGGDLEVVHLVVVDRLFEGDD